ncbi:hypothetical protein HGRIS_005073 [Hohenbuehelia grisea]|uniref:Fungal lipase-type domain-containing protein n=1 Tax=Hohenbuehelia grisea TaxID=104357 RepID=A0ABR3JE44_9AGAR
MSSPYALLGCTALLAVSAIATSTSRYPEAKIAQLKPYTYYASAAYCAPEITLAWSCGESCDANPSFKPIASGGDGDDIQRWYVGYDNHLDTIIVAHQGLNMSNPKAFQTVLDFTPAELPRDVFPGLDRKGVVTHRGFAAAHSRATRDVMNAVEKGLSEHATKKITAVGHSLGAALSLLDAVHIKLKMPDLKVEVVAYGMPRVGNTAFADYVDENIKITRVNNKDDPVPIIPSTDFGYQHPSGELRIHDKGWISCDGQDNENPLCSAGSIASLFAGEIEDHMGPYDGLVIGCRPSLTSKPIVEPVVINEDTKPLESLNGTPRVENIVADPVADKNTPASTIAVAPQVPKDEL